MPDRGSGSVCVAVTQVALRRALERLPALRLDPDRLPVVSGLVFRKPDTVHVVWG